jgi:hypothetical protein
MVHSMNSVGHRFLPRVVAYAEAVAEATTATASFVPAMSPKREKMGLCAKPLGLHTRPSGPNFAHYTNRMFERIGSICFGAAASQRFGPPTRNSPLPSKPLNSVKQNRHAQAQKHSRRINGLRFRDNSALDDQPILGQFPLA